MGSENSAYLGGKLLIAMPGMEDPRFHKAVILLCAHDVNGAMGLILNHVLPGIDFTKLAEQLSLPVHFSMPLPSFNLPVLSGGPVEGARGFLLHSLDFKQADTVSVEPDFGVTGTIEALKAVIGGHGPRHVLFLLGYAGWGAGQLETEIQQNAWLVCEPDTQIVFETGPEDKWERAIKKLGVDPALLSTATGRA